MTTTTPSTIWLLTWSWSFVSFPPGSGGWKTGGDATEMMNDTSHPWLSFNINNGDMLVIMETDNAPAWLKNHDDLKELQAELYVNVVG
jgi:hypothetical protein